MTSPADGMNIRGAVDLSALAAPATQDVPVSGTYVVEATASTFTAVVEQSKTVPVIVDLYSGRSQASVELTKTLNSLVEAYAGKFLLVRVNADTEPDIAAAFGVQAVPTTVAIVKTQPIPLFQGVHEASAIKQVLDNILQVAAENGVNGTLPPPEGDTEAQEVVEEPLSPNIEAAYEAIENEDYDAAIAAYEAELAVNPADAEAKLGIVQVKLLRRIGSEDPQAIVDAAGHGDETNVDAHLRAADVEMSRGEYATAFTRLLAVVKANAGPEKERARERLVELFLLAPEGSPEVAEARKQLALLLF